MPLQDYLEDDNSIIDEWTLYNSEIIEHAESSIDGTKPIFLFTQTFKRSNLISTNMLKCNRFYRRHMIGMFDQAFDSYCILPELHADGIIHYHGWYTVGNYQYLHRVLLPNMRNKGHIDIKLAKYVKKFDFESVENSLWYYKKDLCDNASLFKNEYVMANTELSTNKMTDPVIKVKKTIIHHFTDEEYKIMLAEEQVNIEDNMKIFLKI